MLLNIHTEYYISNIPSYNNSCILRVCFLLLYYLIGVFPSLQRYIFDNQLFTLLLFRYV